MIWLKTCRTLYFTTQGHVCFLFPRLEKDDGRETIMWRGATGTIHLPHLALPDDREKGKQSEKWLPYLIYGERKKNRIREMVEHYVTM